MLWSIAGILMGLWLVGMISNYTLGGSIHILFIASIITILVRVIRSVIANN